METDDTKRIYRMVKHTHRNGVISYGIHELYVDKKGNLILWSKTPAQVSVIGDPSLCSMMLLDMNDALMYPIIDAEKLDSGLTGGLPTGMLWV